jgi:hypothetical protein
VSRQSFLLYPNKVPDPCIPSLSTALFVSSSGRSCRRPSCLRRRLDWRVQRGWLQPDRPPRSMGHSTCQRRPLWVLLLWARCVSKHIQLHGQQTTVSASADRNVSGNPGGNWMFVLTSCLTITLYIVHFQLVLQFA